MIYIVVRIAASRMFQKANVLAYDTLIDDKIFYQGSQSTI